MLLARFFGSIQNIVGNNDGLIFIIKKEFAALKANNNILLANDLQM